MTDINRLGTEAALRDVFALGELTVDRRAGQVRGPGGCEQLDPKVMNVLLMLAERSGEVLRREELLDKGWPGVIVSDDALSRCIYQLRRHLSVAGGGARYKGLLETFPKRGYRLNVVAQAPAEVSAGTAPLVAATYPSTVRHAWLVAAAFAAIVGIVLAGLWGLPREREFSIAVFPFSSQGTAADKIESFCERPQRATRVTTRAD